MDIAPTGRTIPEVTHHHVELDGTRLHHVAAGTHGTPILLVHGFPESWWTFHKVIPLLAEAHRVVAVDLRGFGDSGTATDAFDSTAAAEDLHRLIEHLGVGPVHLVGQDISGATVVRLVTTYPQDVRSLTAIEMGLPGFGLEALADVTHGGAWHIGALAAPGIPELVLAGRERELLGGHLFPAMSATPGAITDADVEEFARTYARPDGWRGAAGLYRSMLREGEEIRAITRSPGLTVPVLAIGAGGGPFTADTMSRATGGEVSAAQLAGVGHYAAMEAPGEVARALLDFLTDVDAR
ncbi:alpha/beta fold hydrolase [Actinotalea subterranea]|uniref:alpha/beta fold hydrolase n=1 Tax=Actinotalea subterranea TaxID=2607497 RepID=UPI0011F072CD|nr:alpha/beta hydrolase [Actinotalea subterranea]